MYSTLIIFTNTEYSRDGNCPGGKRRDGEMSGQERRRERNCPGGEFSVIQLKNIPLRLALIEFLGFKSEIRSKCYNS